MLAISLVRVVRGCRGGMYESVQDAEKRKRSVCGVWWMKKVEEQSREVACFCYERKENTAVFGKSRLSPVACMTTWPRAQQTPMTNRHVKAKGR